MKEFEKDKKLLAWAILLIALVQMPCFALTPAINQITTSVFPEAKLTAVQTIMQMPNIISPIIAIVMALVISKSVISKKAVIVIGLLIVAASGVLSFLFHTQFWHLWFLCCTLGVGLGGYISAASSLIFDNFETDEKRIISGYQTSFINGGGILMSLCGGLLATLCWYGGFLMLIIALPIAIFAIFAIPNRKNEPENDITNEKTVPVSKIKLHPDVFLFGALIFILMLIYNVIGNNLSTHISSIGNSKLAGYATATQMAGGAIFGIFYRKLDEKIGEYTSSLAFVSMFVCMMLLSIFPDSLILTLVAVFIGGSALSLMMPTCVFSVSKVTNETSSALATSITNCICPGVGSFLSALVFTSITEKLYGDSTVFRYRFTAFVSLAVAVIVFAIVYFRNRKKEKQAFA